METIFVDRLAIDVQSSSLKSVAGQKRLHNILWANNLDRTGLSYLEKTRQIIIHRTPYSEEICIQYPGKETRRTEGKTRPNDFIPRIKTKEGYTKNLNFRDIWKTLFEQIEPRKKQMKDEIQMLAALFYRMAFMTDHVMNDQPTMILKELSYDNNKAEIIEHEEIRKQNSYYHYNPPSEIVKYLAKKIDCSPISFEAYLHYNNLLAWNEDCKYYFRELQKGKPWMKETGRVNTLLTHITMLGYLLGEIRDLDVFYRFCTGNGVAPVENDEIPRITGGLVQKPQTRLLD